MVLHLLNPAQDKEKPQAVRTANIMAARGTIAEDVFGVRLLIRGCSCRRCNQNSKMYIGSLGGLCSDLA